MTARLTFPEYEGLINPIIRKHRLRLGLTHREMTIRVGYASVKKGDPWQEFEDENKNRTLSTPALLKVCEILGPDFVEEVADELWKAAKHGLELQRERHLDKARELTGEIRDRQRRPLPPIPTTQPITKQEQAQ